MKTSRVRCGALEAAEGAQGEQAAAWVDDAWLQGRRWKQKVGSLVEVTVSTQYCIYAVSGTRMWHLPAHIVACDDTDRTCSWSLHCSCGACQAQEDCGL